MKKNHLVQGAIVLLVLLFASCSLFHDVIVGSWQQVSVGIVNTVSLGNVLEFTDRTYTASVLGTTVDAGTWTKSGSTYSLNGALLGFLASSATLTPAFSNSNNTMTYTDALSAVEIYNRQ
jgi:hypothetical protein